MNQNPFEAFLGNPMQGMFDQFKAKCKAENPQLYEKAEGMVEGKSEAELKRTAMNLAKERGIDLKKFASQFGIKI